MKHFENSDSIFLRPNFEKSVDVGIFLLYINIEIFCFFFTVQREDAKR